MKEEPSESFRISDKEKLFTSVREITFADDPDFVEQAIEEFKRRRADVCAGWSEEAFKSMTFSTEQRWGRAVFGEVDSDVYMLSEKGEGPEKPLSEDVTCDIGIYASLDPSDEGGPAFYEDKPFCVIHVDRETALSYEAGEEIPLREFLLTNFPESRAAFLKWEKILMDAQAAREEPAS